MRRKLTTTLFALLILSVTAEIVASQDGPPYPVTIREINEIPEAQLAELNEKGADLTNDEIDLLVRSAWADSLVEFTAVLLSDPLNSGLASVSDGVPGRVHVFVRDTSANTLGVEGMTIQLVDNNYETTGMMDATPGDVVEVVGNVTYFGRTVQIDPVSLSIVGNYDQFDISDDIMNPVTITTSEATSILDGTGGLMQVDWDRFSELNNQYVRIEDATIFVSNEWQSGRFNLDFSSDNGQTRVGFDDISLRFRNDRVGSYPETFNVRGADDPFIAPPPASVVNAQGYLAFRGTVDAAEVTQPVGAWFRIVLWEDEDLEILRSPPMVSSVSRPETVPGDGPVEIATVVEPFEDFAVESVELHYIFSSDLDDTLSVEMTPMAAKISATSYSAEIPAAPDGDFVRYFIVATDSEGSSTASPTEIYRVLYDGITEIAHVRETATGSRGPSPFAGMTVEMDITARVQNNPSVAGFIVLQDDPELAPWSGLFLEATEGNLANLQRGDEIHITNATVASNMGPQAVAILTGLRDAEYELAENGTGEPYPDKVVTTGQLQDPAVAESHLGMMLRFENVRVTNPDAGFGEWSFATIVGEDVEASVLGVPWSAGLPSNFAVENLEEDQDLEMTRGAWIFSFNNFKLAPESEDDAGVVVSTEPIDNTLPGRFALDQNYPNPFNPATTIQYDVARAGHVTLEVYNMLGQRVATLVDGNVTAGRYQVTFNAGALASGMYLYRLTAGETVLMKKMMLLK